jgi:RHS repeat-associated protein
VGKTPLLIIDGEGCPFWTLPNSNQLQSITVGGVTTTFTQDPTDQSRLGSMTVQDGSQTLYSAEYQYNELDQRNSDTVTETTVADDGTTSTEDASRFYTYDPNQADALTEVTNSADEVLESYSYDGAGNFKNNATLGAANNVNEYANLSYNRRGDLTNDGTYAYGYDALDRLISVTPDSPSSGSTMEEYGYDNQGRRLWNDVSTWAGSWTLSTSYHFLWSGDEMVAKLDGNNNVIQQYAWGPGQNGTDQVLALTDYTGTSPHTYALIYDASGNVSMMVDPLSGAVVASYNYTAYGQALSATGPQAAINPWRAKGYEVDAETPWLAWAKPAVGYGKTREDYLPGGFCMQRDPLNEAGGFNLTGYLGNDPINEVDPNGTSGEIAAGAKEGLKRALWFGGPVLGAIGYIFTDDNPTDRAKQVGADTAQGVKEIGAELINNPPILMPGTTQKIRETASWINGGTDPIPKITVVDKTMGKYAPETALEHGVVKVVGSNVVVFAATAGVAKTFSVVVSAQAVRGGAAASTVVAAESESVVAGENTPANLGNLTPAQIQRIQTFVNNYNAEVNVVGSRAAGTAGPLSDFDYVIGGNARLRSSAKYFLPKGAAGGGLRGTTESGIDIFNANEIPLDPTRPFVQFKPGQPPTSGGPR